MNQFTKFFPFVVLLLGIPLIVAGVHRLESNSSDVAQWLPDEQDARVDYTRFVELFGADDFVFVTWNDCALDDPRVELFSSRLRKNAASLVENVISGPDLIDQLTSNPLHLSHRQAVARLRGLFISRDRSMTGQIVHLTDDGRQSQREVIRQIMLAAAECGISREQVRVGGSVYEAAMADEESYRSYRAYVPMIAVITALLTCLCFRGIKVSLLVLAISIYCYFFSAAMVHFTGGYMNAVLIAMPVLIFVLTLSGAVHLTNYYSDAVHRLGMRGAGRAALKVGWLPCTLSAVSTSIGLGSLAVSEIRPVREFGLYTSGLLLAALVILLVALPTAFDVLHRQLSKWATTYRSPSASEKSSPAVNWFINAIVTHPTLVSGVTGAFVLSMGMGIAHIKTTVKIVNLFHADSELIQNYDWLETHFGPLVPIEVLVHFEEQCELDLMEQAALVRAIHIGLSKEPEIGGVLSAATFLPNDPSGNAIAKTARRAAYRKILHSRQDDLRNRGLLAVDIDNHVWRISARTPALHEDDCEMFVRQVAASVQRSLDDFLPKSSSNEHVHVSYTGLLPMINRAQYQLLLDLVKSFGLAALLILPVMILVLRSVMLGLLAMIPNLAPIAVVFGGMGWLGIEIDIGTMLTASVALGIAIDDTLHFLTWFRRGVSEGLESKEAVRFAFNKCAVAMVQTTVIAAFGLLVLVQSTYAPTSRFALLIALLLFAALIGDLVLLPALLASRVGRLFSRRIIKNSV